MPISTSAVFDRFGAPYDAVSVVDAASMALNVTAYEQYSPLYLPVTFATTYGIAMMLTSSLIVHTAIYHGRDISRGLRKIQVSEDIHMKLMRAYPEVPEWWYFITLVLSVGLSIVAVAVSFKSPGVISIDLAAILISFPFFSAGTLKCRFGH